MGGLSIWHWLIIGAIVLVIFGGGGKISQIMGDFGKGVKSFKDGLKDEEAEKAAAAAAATKPVEVDKVADVAKPAPSPQAPTVEDERKI